MEILIVLKGGLNSFKFDNDVVYVTLHYASTQI